MNKTPARAFTLIEIIVCMAIFAVGFAAVAMMLPAGAVMQRDIEARGFGDIVGRNALEVAKGKGMQSLTFDYKGSTVPLPLDLNGSYWSFIPNSAYDKDMDWVLHNPSASPGANPIGNWHIGQCEATLKPYFDTDNNGDMIVYSQNGYFASDHGDCTNMALGRIHVFKERPVPGKNSSHINPLDFSFPSSVLDLAGRTYFATMLRTNQSTTYLANGGGKPFTTSAPETHQWQLTSVVLRRDAGAEWPEQVECDPASGSAFQVDPVVSGTQTPVNCLSNTPVDFRSIGGDAELVGKTDNASAPFLWPTYATALDSGGKIAAGIPATGGDPTCANALLRGWCAVTPGDDDGNTLGELMVRFGGGPRWDYAYWSYYMAAPYRDPTPSAYGYPTASPAFRYPIPGVLKMPAIAYDRDNDLLLLRYPQCFAKTPVASDTRAVKFLSGCKLDVAWQDRRLKVGDKFMTGRGAYPFTVREILDAASAAGTAPGGPVDWSDGTYQIVRVSPSLRDTTYTANKPVGRYHKSFWEDPCPLMVLMAPPPVSGGPSPWTSTQQMNDGGTNTQNGVVFRAWNNLTE